MIEEKGILDLNEDNKNNQDSSPKTLETGTCHETKTYSKDENKTISSTNKKSKKEKPSYLNLESRNTTNGFYNNKYRNTSRTENNK